MTRKPKQPITRDTIPANISRARFAERAYQEAYSRVKERTGSDVHAQLAGKDAWVNCLPELDSRANIQAYIACVAWAAARRLLAKHESTQMLYCAQLALAAHSTGGER